MKDSSAKIKVYELAKLLNLSSKDCLKYLDLSGLRDISSYMTSLTPEEVAYFEDWWKDEKKNYIKEVEKPKKKAEVVKKPAAKKVATPKPKTTKAKPEKKEEPAKTEVVAEEKKVEHFEVKPPVKKEKKVELPVEKVHEEKKEEEAAQGVAETQKKDKQDAQVVTTEITKKEKKFKKISLAKVENGAKASFTLPIEEVLEPKPPVLEVKEQGKEEELLKIKDEEKSPIQIQEVGTDKKTMPVIPVKEVTEEEEEELRRGGPRKKKKKMKIDQQTVDDSIKRTLAEMYGVDRQRFKKKRKPREESRNQEEEGERRKSIIIEGFLTSAEISQLLEVKIEQILAKLAEMGIIVSLNQPLDYDTIVMLGDEFGADIEIRTLKESKQIGERIEKHSSKEEAREKLASRPPVVTVMGHVDHGKTSILDYIRKTDVAAKEAGGITQHIGAYSLKLPDKRVITFIDTPGHEAFTAMRARGAQVTDIVVLVVAADERVMPQTIEAINHARAANVPVIVAINKCDLPAANPLKIKTDLSQHGILLEEFGGDVLAIQVSARTGQGINELLDNILLLAEVSDLKAARDVPAVGTVLEAKIDRGIGVVITVLVKEGVLKIGDNYVVGIYEGTVRNMLDDKGGVVKTATPSTPVLVIGTDGMPKVGDRLEVVSDKREAHRISEERKIAVRKRELTVVEDAITMDNIYEKLLEDEKVVLNMILKTDVQGSIEAISDAIFKLDKEGKIQFIHKAVGTITESDVLLAKGSKAIILGYNVRPTGKIAKMAEVEKVDIRLYTIIYELLEDIEKALLGTMEAKLREEIHGRVEIRALFRIARLGTIAGCFVVDGKVYRKDKVRILRDGKVIYDGKIKSLRHIKDDVSEVAKGYECGISIEDYNDVKEGDVLETYDIVTEEVSLL